MCVCTYLVCARLCPCVYTKNTLARAHTHTHTHTMSNESPAAGGSGGARDEGGVGGRGGGGDGGGGGGFIVGGGGGGLGVTWITGEGMQVFPSAVAWGEWKLVHP